VHEVVVEGMVVVAAGRVYATSRPGVLARPRRGNVDLPDLDAPERSPAEPPAPVVRGGSADRWLVPAASLGLAAVVGGAIARAAIVLI
jgi:hypothetical protein